LGWGGEEEDGCVEGVWEAVAGLIAEESLDGEEEVGDLRVGADLRLQVALIAFGWAFDLNASAEGDENESGG